jgi:hypothetical protein
VCGCGNASTKFQVVPQDTQLEPCDDFLTSRWGIAQIIGDLTKQLHDLLLVVNQML